MQGYFQKMNPGSIVQCRSREWVLLPSDQKDLLFLRPLTGATDEVVAVHKALPPTARDYTQARYPWFDCRVTPPHPCKGNVRRET